MLELIQKKRSRLGNLTLKLLQQVEGRVTYCAQENDSKEKFIIKSLDRDKITQLVKAISATEHAHNKGFKYLPKIIPADDNRSWIDTDDSIIFMSSYIDGMHPQGSVTTFGKIGKLVAQLHNISIEGCSFDSDRDLEHEIDVLISNATRFGLGGEYLSIVHKLPDFRHLPKCLIHTDVHVGNVIETTDGDMHLIDCDALAIGTRIFDLGFFITQQFINLDLEYNIKRAKSFFREYQNNLDMPLTEFEKKYTVDAGLFYSLVCSVFGDIKKNIKRIEWVNDNRELLYNSIFR